MIFTTKTTLRVFSGLFLTAAVAWLFFLNRADQRKDGPFRETAGAALASPSDAVAAPEPGSDPALPSNDAGDVSIPQMETRLREIADLSRKLNAALLRESQKTRSARQK